MTTETKSMNFERVGGTAILAAVGSVKNGLQEAEYNRYDWLWQFLHDKHLTHAAGIQKLASLDDKETMDLLSTSLERISTAIGLTGPNAEVFQKADIPRITKLLKEAHRLAQNPEALNKWAARPNY